VTDRTRPSRLQLAQGELEGFTDGGIHTFLGVPYAAPPFGARRLLPPQRPEPWAGVRSAIDYGATVPKAGYIAPWDTLLPEVDKAGEDCLNLNVWTPDPSAHGLPVLVWIHGGAFMHGSGSIDWYEGSPFARDGVVCVTINYRLGAEGFLCTDDGAANHGLLDQIAALEWVRDNIAVFGGDNGRVTIAGESAGAVSVGNLYCSPRAAGLFQRAIAQSGALHFSVPVELGLRVSTRLASALGVPHTRQAIADLDVNKVLQAAQSLEDEVRANPAAPEWRGFDGFMPFRPVAQTGVVPLDPLADIAAGTSGDVPLLIGTNVDEVRLWLVPTGMIEAVDDQILKASAAGYGLDPAAIASYRAGRPGASAGEILAAVGTDYLFRIPAIRIAEARFDADTPTWMYEFAWPSPRYEGRLRACHGLEIPFMFDTLDAAGSRPLTGSHPSRHVADVMHAAWVRFATDGTCAWPAYTKTSRSAIRFDVEPQVIDDPAAHERDAWNGRR
jgi:para-nitrobenzyl esterase